MLRNNNYQLAWLLRWSLLSKGSKHNGAVAINRAFQLEVSSLFIQLQLLLPGNNPSSSSSQQQQLPLHLLSLILTTFFMEGVYRKQTRKTILKKAEKNIIYFIQLYRKLKKKMGDGMGRKKTFEINV